jgi:hypothetical protein
VPEFLDATHRFMLITAEKPEDRKRINNLLIGPLSGGGEAPVDERAGFAPPSWWKGDEYASRSGQLAALTLKR